MCGLNYITFFVLRTFSSILNIYLSLCDAFDIFQTNRCRSGDESNAIRIFLLLPLQIGERARGIVSLLSRGKLFFNYRQIFIFYRRIFSHFAFHSHQILTGLTMFAPKPRLQRQQAPSPNKVTRRLRSRCGEEEPSSRLYTLPVSNVSSVYTAPWIDITRVT